MFEVIPKILIIALPFLLLNNILSSIKKRKFFLSLNYNNILIFLIIFFTVIFTSLISFPFGPQPRHIISIIPFLFIFTGVAIYKISKSNIAMVAIMIFILFFLLPLTQFFIPALETCSSNEFACGDEPNNNPLAYIVLTNLLTQSKIHKYLYGIIKEYKEGFKDGTRDVTQYLLSHGNRNDTIYCHDFALSRNLMFTTNMQVFPFSLKKEIYNKMFPNKKPVFIIPDHENNMGDWGEYALTNCEMKVIKIHRPFRAWDANRPSSGVSSYYYETNLVNFTIYECSTDSKT